MSPAKNQILHNGIARVSWALTVSVSPSVASFQINCEATSEARSHHAKKKQASFPLGWSATGSTGSTADHLKNAPSSQARLVSRAPLPFCNGQLLLSRFSTEGSHGRIWSSSTKKAKLVSKGYVCYRHLTLKQPCLRSLHVGCWVKQVKQGRGRWAYTAWTLTIQYVHSSAWRWKNASQHHVIKPTANCHGKPKPRETTELLVLPPPSPSEDPSFLSPQQTTAPEFSLSTSRPIVEAKRLQRNPMRAGPAIGIAPPSRFPSHPMSARFAMEPWQIRINAVC